MVTITLDPTASLQHGGITLGGSSPSLSTMVWWIDNEETTRTNGFTRNGTIWKLDIPFPSNVFSISIKATLNGESSNVLNYSFNSGISAPIASFQNNEFDELGAANGIFRIPAETNDNFRRRILDTHVNVGNATKLGLANSIERELDLPHLKPFFFLSSRWNPITKDIYKRVTLDFESTRVTAQFHEWVIVNELLEVSSMDYTAVLTEVIGSEIPEIDNNIIVTNGIRKLPDNSIIILDDKTIKIDITKTTVDLNIQLHITYPYKKVFNYSYYDNINKEKKHRTVLEVKQWLEGLDTVTNEYSEVVPTIVWNDGYLNPITTIPSTFTSRSTVEDAINRPVSGYIKIVENLEDEFYEYINNFPAKSFFKAYQIYTIGLLDLTQFPFPMSGTWPILHYLADQKFIETMKAENKHKKLKHYANALRRLTRMGIENSIVNYDYWDSDSPTRIGNNFIPSIRDANLGQHEILTNEGNLQKLTLNQRRYYAKKLAMLHR